MTDFSGTYAFVYGGPKGVGAGYVVIEGDIVRAKDTGGWETTGKLVSGAPGGFIKLVGETKMPSGTHNVGGSSTLDMNVTGKFEGMLPVDFANGLPFTWATPSGPVNAMAGKIDANYPMRFERAAAGLGL